MHRYKGSVLCTYIQDGDLLFLENPLANRCELFRKPCPPNLSFKLLRMGIIEIKYLILNDFLKLPKIRHTFIISIFTFIVNFSYSRPMLLNLSSENTLALNV
jgi:hypothetical protein